MAYLTTQQRNSLERAVVAARKAAELGARNALISLAVDQTNAFSSLTAEQMNLREQLRNKARLLGDVLEDGSQSIDHLVNELAYEYWHKMLFARFLEANNLLMHPDGVPVSMEDCEELGTELGLEDKWDVASTFASQMLPAIFRPSDPVLQVRYATNDKIKLESILDELDKSIFIADDSLGWVYQFWQSEAKAIINAGGEKIDGGKLPAVTQLFTEPYMVHFLIDNTIGAWWLSRNQGVAPTVNFDYLRFLDDGTPAAGSYPGWPDKCALLTVMDPCMGSGHFVVAVFLVLVRLRMDEESLSIEDAIDRVITENIHGLEIDPRCTQIAAFNLAFAAWRLFGGFRELPEMNLACTGIAPKGKIEDWLELVDNVAPSDTRTRLENGMKMLYEHFQLAPELGSLLDPTTVKPDAFTASFAELKPMLLKAFKNESDSGLSIRGVLASGLAKVGDLLENRYTLQITNVPYLAVGKQGDVLVKHCSRFFQNAKGDLATVFLESMLRTAVPGGTVCCAIPQNWLFLTRCKTLRESLLNSYKWDFVVRLGAGAFSQITGEVVKAVLIGVTKMQPPVDATFNSIDVSDVQVAESKSKQLKIEKLVVLSQVEQLRNPDSRILHTSLGSDPMLSEYATVLAGYSAGDSVRFERFHWEMDLANNKDWNYLQSTSFETRLYHGRSKIVYWQEERGEIYKLAQSVRHQNHIAQNWLRGKPSWGKKGVVINQMGGLSATIYTGDIYDCNCCALIPLKEEHLMPIWCYCSSPQFSMRVREIDQKMNVTNATLIKVQFDLAYWESVARSLFPKGLPKPYSDDPTQRLFHGNPKNANNPMQICVARFLGYRFPAEVDKDMELSEDAIKLMVFIKDFDKLTDEDGIVCIPSVNGEYPASDRIGSYVKSVFEDGWDHDSVGRLLHQEGSKVTKMEDWLRDEYFDGQCQLFQNRPFIWHIWDGRKDGFSALVNYHKLNKENLLKLIYGYLGDWIRQCESKVKAGESGAEGLVVAALTLQNKLKLILEGEPPYDIFVRWKPLHEQPMGWEPDPNDGVRINIRPFIEAGVLRKKVKIKYGIDRGKNPPGSPWGEIRDNDTHLTLAEKREAREKRKEK